MIFLGDSRAVTLRVLLRRLGLFLLPPNDDLSSLPDRALPSWASPRYAIVLARRRSFANVGSNPHKPQSGDVPSPALARPRGSCGFLLGPSL